MGSILCEHCVAACCRYLAIEIDKPKTARDFDDIRWYIMHTGISVFVEEGDWYIQIQTTCKNLGADNRCQIYDVRPDICRDYEPGECDYSTGPSAYDHFFTHPQQVEQYYKQKTGRTIGPLRRAQARRRLPSRKRKSALI